MDELRSTLPRKPGEGLRRSWYLSEVVRLSKECYVVVMAPCIPRTHKPGCSTILDVEFHPRMRVCLAVAHVADTLAGGIRGEQAILS